MKTETTGEEIYNMIKDAEKLLYPLSEALACPKIDFGHLDATYLQSKFISLKNTVKHIDDQFKYVKKHKNK